MNCVLLFWDQGSSAASSCEGRQWAQIGPKYTLLMPEVVERGRHACCIMYGSVFSISIFLHRCKPDVWKMGARKE